MTEDPQIKEQQRVIALSEIAFTFLHLGLISYSLGALGEAQKMLVEKKRWMTDEAFLHGLGLSQLLPGAPAVNLNCYIGYYLRGLPGALTAGVFFVLPCLASMVFLAHLYLAYNSIPIVSSLFKGIGALVVGLVFNTVLNLWKGGVNTLQLTVLAVGGFVLVYFYKVGIMPLLFLAGGISMVFAFFTVRISGWRTIMGKAFWSTPKTVQKNITAIRFDFSPKKYLTMLVMLAGILAVNFAVNYSSPSFKNLGNTLFKIGGLTFGSGYAMLPFIQEAVVSQYHWVTQKEFGVALALSLVTPGPVTVIAAFIGYKVAGITGAALAMVNMYLPAFAVVNIISDVYNRAGRAENIKLVVKGIVAAFIGTLGAVVIKMAGSSLVDPPTWGMALAAFAVQRFTKTDTILIVMGGAVISMLIFS